MRGSRPASSPSLFACWALAVLSGMAASPPEIVRVRVPESGVAAFFPAGSDLRVLTPDRFEQLARDAAIPAPGRAGPRLIRASHAARWEGGILSGRSDLTPSAPGGGDALLILDPWSPALVGNGAGRELARATPDGRLGLRAVPAGTAAIAVDWEARARPGSGGSAFLLALPDAGVASLTLDLPEASTPQADAGVRFDRLKAADPGRSAWRVEGARGRLAIRLLDRPGPGRVMVGPETLWLSGPTRVDLNDRAANWRAEWTVEGPAGRPGRLTIELDPGLDLVDVTGPRVASFRPEGSTATIDLGPGDGLPSPLTIRAACRVATDRPWPVPSARPVDAAWTGGRTTVRLDDSHVLQSCSERSGRRVAPRPGEPSGPSSLAFEPGASPGPVADLTFHRPTFDASAEINGLLQLGREVPTSETLVEWRVDRGRMPAQAVDLSPGWSPDGVTSPDGQAVSWHAEPLANGSVRVHMTPPSDGSTDRPPALKIRARAARAGIFGPLDLPRVRPSTASVRVSDETWVATIDPALAARPIFARGLAWLDPPRGSAPWADADLRGSLAWRWLTDDAEARVDRSPATPAPSAEVALRATIARGRLTLEWTLDVESSGDEVRSIPIRVDEGADLPSRWVPSEPGRPAIVARRMAEDRRTLQSFPRGGTAWSIEPSGGPTARVQLKGRLERQWPGSGAIPIITLPPRYQARGSISVRVEDTARLGLDAPGLTQIEGVDATDGAIAPASASPGPDESGLRTAATFGYRKAGGRLFVRTVPGNPEPAGGVVREACLTTQAFRGSGLMQHRLTLRVAADTSGFLDLTMPEGVAIERARRDGQPIGLTPAGRSLRIPIPAPSPGRPASLVTLDYRTREDFRTGKIRPADLLPAIANPCASFLWELTTPGNWRVDLPAGGLVDADPEAARGSFSTVLGLHPFPWPPMLKAPRGMDRAAMLEDLDRSQAEDPREESLGDWLVRLDANRWPLVIDRLALQATGLGPASRVVPVLPGAASRGAPSVVLQELGLDVVPGDGWLLITAAGRDLGRPGIGPGSSEDGSSPLAAAIREGADASDRFQTPARWRGEPTPRPSASGVTVDRLGVPGGWKTRRLIATGWPSATTAISWVDTDSGGRMGWLVAASAALVGILTRDRPARARASAFALAWAVAAVGIARGWPEPSPAWIGLIRGGLVAAAYWLGRSAREFLGPRPPSGTASGRSRGSSRARVAVLALALAAVGAATLAGGDSPIVAVLPYEGAPDLAAGPSRVVMLLEDYERLARMARPAPPEAARVNLAAIRHRVARPEEATATIETLCDVEVEGEGAASWSFPVGPAFDLSATVDARPSSLAIAGDGRTASLSVEGAGGHRISFRRSVPIAPFGPDGERLRVPVNRSAFARVEVARDSRGRWVEVPGASGRVEVGADGLAGGLGPAETLEVRWFAEDQPPAVGPRGEVDARVLWEAQPVGDLVRLRLGHTDAEGIAAIGLALEPGVLVRGHAIPGAIVDRPGGSPGHPTWSVGIDPPLPKGVPIEVTLWRPAVPGATERRLPGFRILGDPEVNGILGFRRPVDWAGQLAAPDEHEARPDSDFARSWGALPDDGLTLAGAIRLGRSTSPVVTTGPASLARTVRTSVVGELNPGRLDVAIEADLVDRRGRSFEVVAEIPADFRVVRVAAEGLVDWLRVARDRVRLQFDGASGPSRKIKIRGYLPAPSVAVLAEARAYECKVPWPLWSDAEATPGELTLGSSGRFQLATAEGVVEAAPPGLDDEGVGYRASYRVDRPDGLGVLRWSSPKARVGVSVASDLTLDPSAATWTAVVDNEISGGPVGSLHWKLPTEWAQGASVEVVGSPHRLAAEIKGDSTSWDIFPESPLWGRARIILRSRRPIASGDFFAYPEITPLASAGRGSVASYDLAIANVSGRPLEVAGSPGLQAIDPSRYRSAESHAPAGSIRRAYHVTGDRWSLRLRLGPGRPPGQGDFAAASDARISLGLGRDGATWGRASYALSGGPAPFFRVRLAEGVQVPWASVDGRSVPVLLEGDGRRLIPLGDRPPARVELAWYAPARGGRRGEIAIPEVEGRGIPALIEAASPGPAGSLAASAGLTRLDRPGWEAANLGRLSGRIVEHLTEFDRGSREDRDAVLADLVEFELRARDLDRARPAASPAALALARSARGSIEDASQMAGLDDLLEEARAAVGLAPPRVDGVEPRPIEPSEQFRVRRVGHPTYYQGKIGGEGGPTVLAWEIPTPAGRWSDAEPWAILGLGFMVALGMAGIISRPFRPHGWAGKLALGLASASALALEPIGLAALVVAFFAGRAGDPSGRAGE